MFESIAAFDIGSSSVKLITMKTGIRNFQVASLSYEDIDAGADSAEDALLAALAKITEDIDLSGYTVLTNLPMENSIVRTITFPFSDPEKIAAAIPFEAEENIPFKIDDLVMDFQSLRSVHPGEGRVMLGAARREQVREFLSRLGGLRIKPSRLGLESNALFACYRYFNRIPEESVIQIDVGHKKTIVNIIQNNRLLHTRCISSGIGSLHAALASMNKIPLSEAGSLFEKSGLDLTSLENNYSRDAHTSLGMSRQRFKKFYETCVAAIGDLIEQILLTIKSFAVDYGDIDFSRILISGGGANIAGVGQALSSGLGLPVVSLPFLNGYAEQKIQTQFPIAFGTAISAIDRSLPAINYLQGEFVPDFVASSRKIYYIAGAFASLTAVLLVVNIGISAFVNIKNRSHYRELINERFSRYFHIRPVPDDPLKAAMKIVNDEKKELNSIDAVLQSGDHVVDVLNDIIRYFPSDDTFQLSNLVINESVVRIDGQSSTSRYIDEFKNRLLDSKRFDSVNLNTNINKKNEVTFSLVIKQKISGGVKRD